MIKQNKIKLVFTLIMMLLIMSISISCKRQEKLTEPDGNVMIYSSMPEAILKNLKTAFEKKYPNVTLSYFMGNNEQIVNKIVNENMFEQIEADVVWSENILDMEYLKSNECLAKYYSNESRKIPKIYKDKESFYTGVKTMSVGILSDEEAFDKKDIPKSYNSLLDTVYKDKIAMTNPTTASVMRFFVAALMQNKSYGENYFKGLKENNIKFVDGATDTVKEIQNKNKNVGLTIDTVCKNYVKDESMKGTSDDGSFVSTLRFNYVNKDVVTLVSPVALLKNSYNPNNGKHLINFILSKEFAEILRDENDAVSARTDVKNFIDNKNVYKHSMKIDYKDLIENLNSYIDKFNEIYK